MEPQKKKGMNMSNVPPWSLYSGNGNHPVVIPTDRNVNHGFTGDNVRKLAEQMRLDPELGTRSRVVIPFGKEVKATVPPALAVAKELPPSPQAPLKLSDFRAAYIMSN
ncbi:unnamed protein product [Chrysodeixis includens]|uniref:Uncharacterized protein n=1 Tax=Chrysodeixis includens TaxID=689277 RepID=A0A9P0BIS4_CHRIL|nr:unnamed protein product [Chrysodeixis includens]